MTNMSAANNAQTDTRRNGKECRSRMRHIGCFSFSPFLPLLANTFPAGGSTLSFFPPSLPLLLDSFQQFPAGSVMNACTETAPDIRVARPARDFLVRAFALFRVTGATGRRSAGRTEATGVDTVWFFVRQARGGGRDLLYRGHRP